MKSNKRLYIDIKPFAKFLMLIALFMGMASLYGFMSMFLDINTYLNQSLAHIFLFGLSALLWSRLFYGSYISHISLKPERTAYFLIIIPMLVLVLMPMVDGLSIWNSSFSFSGDDALREMEENSRNLSRTLLSTDSLLGLLRNLFVFALMPAIFEEFFFRGNMQKVLKDLFKKEWAAVFLTALIFSIVHFQFFTLIPRLLLGLVLGYIYLFSKNLIMPILFHFLHNSAIVIVVYLHSNSLILRDYSEPGAIYSLVGMLIGLAFLALFFVYEFRKRRNIRIFVENLTE